MKREENLLPYSIDIQFTEKLRLLHADPEQYFRENPRPRFGFRPSDEETTGEKDYRLVVSQEI